MYNELPGPVLEQLAEAFSPYDMEAVLGDQRCRSLLLQMPVDKAVRAIEEYDEARDDKGQGIRNKPAYLMVILRKYAGERLPTKSHHEYSEYAEHNDVSSSGRTFVDRFPPPYHGIQQPGWEPLPLSAALAAAPMSTKPPSQKTPRLTATVSLRLEQLFGMGLLQRQEADPSVMGLLHDLPEPTALAALNEYDHSDLNSIRDRGGFLTSILERYRYSQPKPAAAASQPEQSRSSFGAAASFSYGDSVSASTRYDTSSHDQLSMGAPSSDSAVYSPASLSATPYSENYLYPPHRVDPPLSQTSHILQLPAERVSGDLVVPQYASSSPSAPYAGDDYRERSSQGVVAGHLGSGTNPPPITYVENRQPSADGYYGHAPRSKSPLGSGEVQVQPHHQAPPPAAPTFHQPSAEKAGMFAPPQTLLHYSSTTTPQHQEIVQERSDRFAYYQEDPSYPSSSVSQAQAYPYAKPYGSSDTPVINSQTSYSHSTTTQAVEGSYFTNSRTYETGPSLTARPPSPPLNGSSATSSTYRAVPPPSNGLHGTHGRTVAGTVASAAPVPFLSTDATLYSPSITATTSTDAPYSSNVQVDHLALTPMGNLTDEVRRRLDDLYLSGFLNVHDLDERSIASLTTLPEAMAIRAIDEFHGTTRNEIRNPSAFFSALVRKQGSILKKRLGEGGDGGFRRKGFRGEKREREVNDHFNGEGYSLSKSLNGGYGRGGRRRSGGSVGFEDSGGVEHGERDAPPLVLPDRVHFTLQALFAQNLLDERDVDSRLTESLAELSEDIAVAALDEFAACDMSRVRNRSRYLMGLVRRYKDAKAPANTHGRSSSRRGR